jgi:hypothetical protein
MYSSLHSGAGYATPDLAAFIYATQRLPSCMPNVTHVVMGQSRESFMGTAGAFGALGGYNQFGLDAAASLASAEEGTQ